MSYKTKEKKRAKKIAIKRARVDHAETMRSRHYLTLVTRPCRCQDCPARLRKGGEMVYRNEPLQILCKRCADRRRVDYRTSEKWDSLNRKIKRSSTPAPKPKVGPRYSPQALLADLVIEAACAPRCDPDALNRAWTRPTLASWGVAWPPPKGWRRELVDRWAA